MVMGIAAENDRIPQKKNKGIAEEQWVNGNGHCTFWYHPPFH